MSDLHPAPIRVTFFEGRPVNWEDYPSFLLPAEKQLHSGEMRKRAEEAFKQRLHAPDPVKVAENVEASISELEKIREVLVKKE